VGMHCSMHIRRLRNSTAFIPNLGVEQIVFTIYLEVFFELKPKKQYGFSMYGSPLVVSYFCAMRAINNVTISASGRSYPARRLGVRALQPVLFVGSDILCRLSINQVHSSIPSTERKSSPVVTMHVVPCSKIFTCFWHALGTLSSEVV